MTPPPTSVSPPNPLTPHDAVTRAKLDFIAAAYAASPLRVVEKHPMASVTATAAATMAITVIGSSRMFSPVGVGVLGKGVGLLGKFAQSNFASLALQSVIAKFSGVQAGSGSPADVSSPDVNAVG
ncbi:MAG: hypothetical protein JWM57_1041 [Phycisphaerales bacterium]|nr:hypothetical protein [Phycisphaerales bacterium]